MADTNDNILPPDQQNVNPNKRYKTKTNHTVKVINAFNMNRIRMVELNITFDRNENYPGRENTSYEVIIPMQSIGSSNSNLAVEEIRTKLFNQTHYQLFVSSPQKYCRDLMGKLYHFEEKERRQTDAQNKSVFSFDSPKPFDLEGKVYLACGEIWQLSPPIKKLSSQERKELPVIIEYTGESVNFEENEKEVVKTVISLVSRFIKMQVDETVNGFPVAYLSRAVQNALYTVLLKKCYQPVTFCSSLKNEEGIEKTGIGKTLMCKVSQLILKGYFIQGGEFSEPHVFKKVSAGTECICDEMHLSRRETLPGLKAVIAGQFQGLERMVGKGGSPKATVKFHSNKPPSYLNLSNEIRERIIWLYAGIHPLRPDGVLEMFEDAKELYKYLPSTLSIGVQSFYDLIPREKLQEQMDSLGDMAHLAQEFWNLRCFHDNLRTLASKHGINIPNWLSRDVDFRPYLQPDPGAVGGKEPKTLADFLSALDSEGLEGECAMDTYQKKRGLRIWVSAFKGCPKWVKTFANRLPSSARSGRRFRFVEEMEHPLIEKIKSQTESSDSSSDSESSDYEDAPRKTLDLSSARGKTQVSSSESSENEDDPRKTLDLSSARGKTQVSSSESSEEEETQTKTQDSSPTRGKSSVRLEETRQIRRNTPDSSSSSESSEDEDKPKKSIKAREKTLLDSSDEGDASKVSTLTSTEPEFTVNHDQIIMRSIIETKSTGKVMDDDLWKRLKKSSVGKQYLSKYSWESIRNRFHTQLVPNLDYFNGLSPEDIKAIRKGMGLLSPDEERANLDLSASFSVFYENGTENRSIEIVPVSTESQIIVSCPEATNLGTSPRPFSVPIPLGTPSGSFVPGFSPTKSHEGNTENEMHRNSPGEHGYEPMNTEDLLFDPNILQKHVHDELNKSDRSVESEKRKDKNESMDVEDNQAVTNEGTTAKVQIREAKEATEVDHNQVMPSKVQNEEFKCEICEKTFPKKRGLSGHKAKAHKVNKKS